MERTFLNQIKLLLLIVFVAACNVSCKKFVDAGAPITSFNGVNVYDNDATATASVTGIYIRISSAGISGNGGLTSISAICGLSADELTLVKNNAGLLPYFNNALNSTTSTIWSPVYNIIFDANSSIEGLNTSVKLTPAVKKQLLGEAEFIRALCYLYLVNLYGDVPLSLSTDYKINSTLPRAASSDVYNQIIKDLKEAQVNLNSNFVDATGITVTTERVRPSRAAATALLARTYLYINDFINAEKQATDIIDNISMFELVGLNDVFLKNSKETIWSIQSVGTESDSNTKEGQFFIPLSSNINAAETYLTADLFNSFEPADKRKSSWVKQNVVSGIAYFYPYKYKIGRVDAPDSEYGVVLRLAEQYLIRAEARIQLGKISDGVADLNIIRKRASDLTASLPDQLPALSTSLPKADALTAVGNERRHELFTEWGHRWIDLKRYHLADQVLPLNKGNNWQSADQLYPIPQIDIDRDPNLKGHQNPGY